MTSLDPSTPPRRLRRSGSERMLSGTAGGIAGHFALDPALVRIGFVVLTLLGGAGLALYAVCALVMPPEEGAEPLSRRAKVVLGGVLLVAALSFPFAGVFFVGPGLLFALAVGAFIVVAWRAFGGRPDPRLLRASLLVVSVAGAIVVGLAAGFATALGGGVAVAAAVVVAGVALVVGGVLGGARWLIAPALLLAMPVAVVSAADIDFRGGVGEREYRPASMSDVRDSYRLGAGRLRVDLRDVEFTPMTTTAVKLRVGTGRIRLLVGPDVCVQTTAHAGAGHLDLGPGRGSGGVDVDAQRRPEADSGAAVLDVDARAGLGEVLVSADPAACQAR